MGATTKSLVNLAIPTGGDRGERIIARSSQGKCAAAVGSSVARVRESTLAGSEALDSQISRRQRAERRRAVDVERHECIWSAVRQRVRREEQLLELGERTDVRRQARERVVGRAQVLELDQLAEGVGQGLVEEIGTELPELRRGVLGAEEVHHRHGEGHGDEGSQIHAPRRLMRSGPQNLEATHSQCFFGRRRRVLACLGRFRWGRNR